MAPPPTTVWKGLTRLTLTLLRNIFDTPRIFLDHNDLFACNPMIVSKTEICAHKQIIEIIKFVTPRQDICRHANVHQKHTPTKKMMIQSSHATRIDACLRSLVLDTRVLDTRVMCAYKGLS